MKSLKCQMIILMMGLFIYFFHNRSIFYLPKNITIATQDNFKADAHCVPPECNKMAILVADNKRIGK